MSGDNVAVYIGDVSATNKLFFTKFQKLSFELI